ncbi:MAG: hypothetical protein ACE5OZ_03065 [Candidatus Heimdallarchaeota archaeon]
MRSIIDGTKSNGQSLLILIQRHFLVFILPFTVISWFLGIHYWFFGQSPNALNNLLMVIGILVLAAGILWYRVESNSALGLKYRGIMQLMFCLSFWIAGNYLTLTSIEHGSFLFYILDRSRLQLQAHSSVVDWVLLTFIQFFLFWAILGNILLGFMIIGWVNYREEKEIEDN